MLEKKTAVVTGAAKGIGRAVALRLAQEGCHIVLNYRSQVSEELVEQIKSFGVECLPIQGDVSKKEDADSLIKEAKAQFGTVDILVNNAGITRDMLLMRMTEEEFDAVIDTNLKGAFHTMRAVSNVMLKQKSGAIINLASVVGIIGNAGQANYAASKAGVIGMTKSVARELGVRGITCNCIAPGFIETDMTADLKEEWKKQMLEAIPLKRFGKAEEVADAVVFLAKNKYITGQVIHIDGGMVMC